MRKSLPKRDQLLLRIGGAKKEAGRAFSFMSIRLPNKDEEVTRATFSFQVDKTKLKRAQQRDGHYLLRSNLTGLSHFAGFAQGKWLKIRSGDQKVFTTMRAELESVQRLGRLWWAAGVGLAVWFAIDRGQPERPSPAVCGAG